MHAALRVSPPIPAGLLATSHLTIIKRKFIKERCGPILGQDPDNERRFLSQTYTVNVKMNDFEKISEMYSEINRKTAEWTDIIFKRTKDDNRARIIVIAKILDSFMPDVALRGIKQYLGQIGQLDILRAMEKETQVKGVSEYNNLCRTCDHSDNCARQFEYGRQDDCDSYENSD